MSQFFFRIAYDVKEEKNGRELAELWDCCNKGMA